jgi:putative SOS response-associated peptidase YedK
MCGRFASTLPLEQIARMFGIQAPLPNLAPNWNAAPTQRAPRRVGIPELVSVRWTC